MEDEHLKGDTEPAEKNTNLQAILVKALRCFGWGALIRFVFSMLANKFRILQVLSWGKGGSLKGILRFALMSGLFSFIFKFSRFVMHKQKLLQGKLDTKVFISALLSSLTLCILERRDLEILKVIIFPRLCEALYTLAVEKGYITPIPHGETLVAWMTALAIAYSYIYEPANISYSFVRQLDRYCDLSKGERELFDSMRVVVAKHIQDKYHGGAK